MKNIILILLLGIFLSSCKNGLDSINNSNENNNQLTITNIPDNLKCDNNRLLVFLPYVIASDSIERLMTWEVLSANPEIISDKITATFYRGSVYNKTTDEINQLPIYEGNSPNRRILIAAPRGNDINNWTFWIYSNGENIKFNIHDYKSSPSFDFSNSNTLNWNKFKMIPIGNWPEESIVTIPETVSIRTLNQGSLEEKLLLITESQDNNVLYDIMINSDLTVNPLTLTSQANNIYVKIKSGSPFNPSTITLGNYGSLLTVNNSVTVILEDIILKGGKSNTAPLVNIDNNGRILLGSGGKITGNENLQTKGGGVFITSGVLIIDGGEISENESFKQPYGAGGGVYVEDDGRLYLKNGTINNNGAWDGGGVAVDQGIFIMTGGEIYGNLADHGGGVWLNDTSNAFGAGSVSPNTVVFRKTPNNSTRTSGIIYGDTAPAGKSNGASIGSCIYYRWADNYWYFHRNRALNNYDNIDSDNRLINWDFRDGNIYSLDLTENIPENNIYLSDLTSKITPSGNLEEIFRTISEREEENVIYNITVSNDQYLSSQHLFTKGKNVVIRLQGISGSDTTITLSEKGYLFYVHNHVTLILENIILCGISNNDSPLIYINGKVCIENGTVIRDNTNESGTAGGIFVDTGGHIIMNGGEIHDNKCLDYERGSGGGVMLFISSFFHLNNGKIYNNFAEEEGGGVCVYKATFIMYNGEIFNNRGFQGGGMYLNGSVFRKQVAFGQTVSGKIYDNTVPEGTSKVQGFIPRYADGLNIYIGSDTRLYDGNYGANNNIDVTHHLTTDAISVPPWERLK